MDDLDGIPDFLKRKEVPMSAVAADTTKAKAKAKPAIKAPAKTATKPAKAPVEPVKAKPNADVYGYLMGSLKSAAAALYASKGGATLAEVKDKTGSVQLNLLKDLEGRGFKVKRTKEPGAGSRQVTRSHLSN